MIVALTSVLDGLQVYIDGIPPGTSEEELATHFGSIGDVFSWPHPVSCALSSPHAAVLTVAYDVCRRREVRQEAGADACTQSHA